MSERGNTRSRIREIASASNPLLKVFRHALAEGTTRAGWLAVEGPFLVEEALRAERATIHSLLVASSAHEQFQYLLTRVSREAEVAQVGERLFRQVAQTENPQGIAALVELRKCSLEAILREHEVLLLVGCGLQDPGNLGTILRSAQAFGAKAVVTLEGTVSPFNPKATRASAGAVFHVPIFPGERTHSLVKKLRSARVRIVAADRQSPSRISDSDLRAERSFLTSECVLSPGKIGT